MIKDHPPELTYTFIYKMYAIVEINGQQFKAEAGQKLFVHHIEGAENGSTVEFEKVLLVDKDGNVTVDRKSTRLNSSHSRKSRMPSSA